MTPFPTAIATPGALLMRLRHIAFVQERRARHLNHAGNRLVQDSLAAAWDDCIQAGLAGPARVVMGIGGGT